METTESPETQRIPIDRGINPLPHYPRGVGGALRPEPSFIPTSPCGRPSEEGIWPKTGRFFRAVEQKPRNDKRAMRCVWHSKQPLAKFAPYLLPGFILLGIAITIVIGKHPIDAQLLRSRGHGRYLRVRSRRIPAACCRKSAFQVCRSACETSGFARCTRDDTRGILARYPAMNWQIQVPIAASLSRR